MNDYYDSDPNPCAPNHPTSVVMACSPDPVLSRDGETSNACRTCVCRPLAGTHVQGCTAGRWKPPEPRSVRAIDLTAKDLWHWVTITDWEGNEIHGVLHRIELSTITRVVLRVTTRQPTESGGHYWALFGDERYVQQQALVKVGELLPESERWT